MNVLRRLTAAVTTALLLQLTLLGSGGVCGVHHEMAAVPSGTMAGMHHDATAHESASGRVVSPGVEAPQSCDESGNGESCRQPWAPGHCQNMATCPAVTSAPAAQPTGILLVAARAAELPEPARTVSVPAGAPELPPPRA